MRFILFVKIIAPSKSRNLVFSLVRQILFDEPFAPQIYHVLYIIHKRGEQIQVLRVGETSLTRAEGSRARNHPQDERESHEDDGERDTQT